MKKLAFWLICIILLTLLYRTLVPAESFSPDRKMEMMARIEVSTDSGQKAMKAQDYRWAEQSFQLAQTTASMLDPTMATNEQFGFFIAVAQSSMGRFKESEATIDSIIQANDKPLNSVTTAKGEKALANMGLGGNVTPVDMHINMGFTLGCLKFRNILARGDLAAAERQLDMVKNYAEAQKSHLKPTLVGNPSQDIGESMALLDIERAEYDKAIAHLNEIVVSAAAATPQVQQFYYKYLVELAEVFMNAHQDDEALATHERLRKACENKNDAMMRSYLAQSYLQRAGIEDRRTNKDVAAQYYQKAIGMLEQGEKNREKLAGAKVAQAMYFIRQNKLDEAEAALKMTMDLYQQTVTQDHYLYGDAFETTAEVQALRGKFTESAQSLERALACYDKELVADNPRVVNALYGLHAARILSGDPAGAEKTWARLSLVTTRPRGFYLELIQDSQARFIYLLRAKGHESEATRLEQALRQK